MPNRPKGKYLVDEAGKKRTRKDPRSQRSRFAGAEDVTGTFQSSFDIHLMEKRGVDLSKVFIR
jgi:hypothetical protein